MLEDIQTAIPLGFFLSFMVGPVFFVLLQTSAVKGFRAAISFDCGRTSVVSNYWKTSAINLAYLFLVVLFF
jgi:threonine/homoserine/homoserine lactone efflux protein